MNEKEVKPVVEEEGHEEGVVINEVVDGAPTGQNISELNDERLAFMKKFNVFKILGYVSTGIVLAIVIVAYLFIFPIEGGGQWAAIILIIIALVGSVFLTRINRTKMTKAISEYMESYYKKLYEIVMKDEPISNEVFDMKKTQPKEEFINAHILKNVQHTNSRNTLDYTLGDKQITISDFYAYRFENKREEAVFLGKFLVANTEKTIKERILIYIKPNAEIHKEYKGPDDNEGLETFIDNEKLLLMSESEKYKKVISAKHLEVLEGLKTSLYLSDVALSLYDKKVVVTLTYGNDILVIPSKNEAAPAAIEQYKKDIKTIHDFLLLL